MRSKAFVTSLALLVGATLPGYAANIQETQKRYSADNISWYVEQHFTITIASGDTLTGIASQLERKRRAPKYLRIHANLSSISGEDVYRQNKGTIQNPDHIRAGGMLHFYLKDHYNSGNN